jgi:type IV fimbrial biogenesis protein FimT
MQVRRNSIAAQRGVTLVECCAVLAITSVLVGVGAPSFEKVRQKRLLDGASAELALDLHYVRSEAVARNEGVRVSFLDVSGGSCTIIHTGAAADCQCSADGVAQCANGATVLKTTLHPTGRGVSVRAHVGSMRFDQTNGTVTPAATVRVMAADGREVRHVVNIMGRVRSCSPQGSAAGYPPC